MGVKHEVVFSFIKDLITPKTFFLNIWLRKAYET